MMIKQSSLIKIVLLGLSTIIFTGCSKVKSVEYYSENQKEAKEVLIECEAQMNRGKALKGKTLENCENAGRALSNSVMKEILGSL